MVASDTRQTNRRTASNPADSEGKTEKKTNDFSGGIPMNIVGNLVEDPELRFTPSGKAVASFRVACSSRILRDGEWQDGATVFMNCTVWGEQAERLTDMSITKGKRIIVQGKLQERHWENKEGEKRRSMELLADEIGLSLRFTQAGFLTD